jgi:hypothetical protein
MPFTNKELETIAEGLADELNDCLHSDSNFRIDRGRLVEAVLQDLRNNEGCYMTVEEVDEFVMGDDDGHCPKYLLDLFPLTHRLINDHF